METIEKTKRIEIQVGDPSNAYIDCDEQSILFKIDDRNIPYNEYDLNKYDIQNMDFLDYNTQDCVN